MTQIKTDKLYKIKKKEQYEPLSILYSTRIRLDNQQREILKTAFNKLRNERTPAAAAPVLPGSTIKTSTSFNPDFEGLSSITLSSIIGSRESHPIALILQLQRILGVKILDRKKMEEQFVSYLSYLLGDEDAK